MDANHKPDKRYDDDFKRSAVALLETTGRPMAEVAGDLGIPCKTLERWREKYRAPAGQAAVVGGKNPPATQAELAELKELRRRLTHTERERDILKKALDILSPEDKDRGGLS